MRTVQLLSRLYSTSYTSRSQPTSQSKNLRLPQELALAKSEIPTKPDFCRGPKQKPHVGHGFTGTFIRQFLGPNQS